jgi:hypothetical protein
MAVEHGNASSRRTAYVICPRVWQPGSPAVNARDRIGAGPWQNAKGVVIAADPAELHGTNKPNKQTALTGLSPLQRNGRQQDDLQG